MSQPMSEHDKALKVMKTAKATDEARRAFLARARAQHQQHVGRPLEDLEGHLYLVPQGWYARNCAAPCGTAGLATCVGIAIHHIGGVAGGPWYIAHVDAPHEPVGEVEQKAVVNWVKDRLMETLGKPRVEAIFVFNPDQFRQELRSSKDCIVQGIKDWYRAVTEADLPQDKLIAGNSGFYMNAGGNYVVIPLDEQEAREYQAWKKTVYEKAELERRDAGLGIGRFSVPANP